MTVQHTPVFKLAIAKWIEDEIKGTFPIDENDVFMEEPKNRSFGDLATNVAFKLTAKLKNSPINIGNSIADQLNQSKLSAWGQFSSVNGFVNVTLSDAFIYEQAVMLYQRPCRFELTDHERKQKTNLEFVSANPTGPLHIGHTRWAVIGSVLMNILRFTDHQVDSEFYINDAGNQIKLFYDSVNALKANQEIPADGYHGHYIKELAELEEDPLQHNLKAHKKSLKRLGVEFDTWFSEKSLHNSGEVKKAVEVFKSKKLTYESEGALWFKSSNFGDEKDRVLIKADGQYTYFTVDIAYHMNKIKRGYDRLINIWGADHHGYVNRVRASLVALYGDHYKNDDSLTIIIGQLVSLYRNGEQVRMSKRTGEMITLDDVVDEIGVDATRFFLIHKSHDTHLDFDLELALKKSNENPVYYIQYAHARICSILEKLGKAVQTSETLSSPLLEPEKELCLACLQFNDVVWDASQKLLPYKVAHYAVELARTFHSFYEKCPILTASKDVLKTRYFLLLLTKQKLMKSFKLLGISAPESM